MKWTATLAFALVAAVAVAFFVAGCEPKSAVPKTAEAVPHVRVRLLAGVTGCTLAVDQAPVVTLEGSDTAVFLHPVSGLNGLWYDGRWHFGEETLAGGVLHVVPGREGGVAVNGLPYHGAFVFVPVGNGAFDVINDVDVESYLRGVLAKELLPDWKDDAYKAQAVIARTYALYEAKTGPPGRPWDLNPDERSQVYGGIKAETPRSVAAVASTRGQVAAYGPPGQEHIFKAYFSACCGGTCSSAADVFGDPATPALAAKSNGATCAISPRYIWPAVTVAKTELTRRFRLYGQRNAGQKNGAALADLPGVRTIQIATVNPLGRPTAFLLTDTRGQQYRLLAEVLRTAINTDAPAASPGTAPTTVFSAFFQPVDTGDALRFTNGHGYGHGVGACQWCMQARALQGQRYDAIVLSQYPQAVLLAAY